RSFGVLPSRAFPLEPSTAPRRQAALGFASYLLQPVLRQLSYGWGRILDLGDRTSDTINGHPITSAGRALPLASSDGSCFSPVRAPSARVAKASKSIASRISHVTWGRTV